MPTVASDLVVLDAETWLTARSAHEATVDAWTMGRRARASTGTAHPVEDFLFTYYSHKPAQLRRWHPGAGVVLLGDAVEERATWRWHTWVSVSGRDGVTLDVDAFVADRGDAVRRSVDLMRATLQRPPQLGCFGLHEWAMVHRLGPGQQRHEDWPLRLGQSATDAVVESQPLRCSHFDAFRFFTPSARPLNIEQPTRQTQLQLEQPGCLHATMDLYKVAYKLGPAIPSSLTARCFALARDVREIDMRASPYDLSSLGYEPVPVETASGRAQYVTAQRAFTARGQALRAELIDVCEHLLP